mmetsp:Transcript_104392/g.225237  ORF Transcript_104392/g.225237 Transcript_104392/m.225237 type:complete len:884 (-) Transcript_104392:18-2669(-)
MDDLGDDPIVRALERSTIAQTLKAARASLAEPSRPFTPLDRSLFQQSDVGNPQRPTSSYSVDQLRFGLGTARPDSSRSSRSSRQNRFSETILEEDESYRRDGGADVLTLDRDDDSSVPTGRPSPQDSETGASSGSEELTPVVPKRSYDGSAPSPPAGRGPLRPPKPPGSGYPSGPDGMRTGGGYPEVSPPQAPPPLHKKSDASPSARRRKASASPSPKVKSSTSGKMLGTGDDWDTTFEAVLDKLRGIVRSKEGVNKGTEVMVQLCDKIWDLVVDIKAGKGTKPQSHASKLLKEVMGLMDLKDMKDARCQLKLSRSALALLQTDGATEGVAGGHIQGAYLNISRVLFKYSQKGEYDQDFLSEKLIEPLLEVLQSDEPQCASNDLRVYVVGVLKNVSNDEANQKLISKLGAVGVLFKLIGSDQLTGSSKEAQLLIQITATLRNLASHQYKNFVQEERLNALTRIMALFTSHVELMTNISRILAKLTLHTSACEEFAKSDVHIRQISRTLGANLDSPALVLRMAFVLGNMTERSDRLRVVFAFDCEGTALIPQFLGRYWQKERELARINAGSGQAKSGSLQEIEAVLVKLVRLLANIAISATAGSTLAASSAAVDPLLDMLGAKRIGDSEELVLNVVAAVTNLLFYDVPSNLLFQPDNKQLLCRLFRPLLLESYNVEALIETARALGNLSRHPDARQCMATLRIDEILVILLDHDDRDLVFYVCGALVNLGADPDCTARLVDACPVVSKLGKLLGDAAQDPALQLVAVKVLTNLSLDPGLGWSPADVEAVRRNLEQIIADDQGGEPSEEPEQAQLLELARQLLARLDGPAAVDAAAEATAAASPSPEAHSDSADKTYTCPEPGCGRRFDNQEKLKAHVERRHGGN